MKKKRCHDLTDSLLISKRRQEAGKGISFVASKCPNNIFWFRPLHGFNFKLIWHFSAAKVGMNKVKHFITGKPQVP